MGCGASSAPLHIPKTDTEIATTDIKEKYTFGKELGTGSFARVVLGTHKATGAERAIKIINRAELERSRTLIEEEINILSKVGDHENIIKLHEAFTDKKNYYLIMDLCLGGDLFSKIIDDGHFSELDAARYCRQLASALQYMHEKGVTHRDLKPENLLLASKEKGARLQVADFGLSKVTDPSHKLRTVCGTWAYAAPEIIKREPYTPKVDNWSLGVLQFVLLAGYHPFDVYGDLTESMLLHKIIDCEYDFNDKVWDAVSSDAKSIIRKLLKPDANTRMSLKDYLNHPWVKGKEDVCNTKVNPEVLSNMGKFVALVSAQKAARIIKKQAIKMVTEKRTSLSTGGQEEDQAEKGGKVKFVELS